ncbi:MAG: hypothetical protein K5905_16375, partial [Roseibium sp.]|nr:hypothetical protein [Roseibium sp.]
TTPKAPKTEPVPASLEKTPSEPVVSEPPMKAPEVKAEPVSADEPSKSDDNPAPAVKPMSRPFQPRERPSYGRHSITPPASGPAARAKTALAKPVEQETSDKKIEPNLGVPATKDHQGADNSSPAPVIARDETALTSDDRSPIAVSSEGPSLSTASVADTSTETAGTLGGAAAPEVEIPKTVEASSSEASIAEADAAAPPPLQGDTSGDFGLSDIVEDAAEKSQDESTTSEDVSSKDEQTPDKAHSPKQEQQAKAAAPALANKNPIEDEMAKLLDELGGQPN